VKAKSKPKTKVKTKSAKTKKIKTKKKKAKKKRVYKPKRFYVMGNSRNNFEVIDLESIIYLKVSSERCRNVHTTKVTHCIIFASGAELKGNEKRKTEGGKPCWSERLARTWANYIK
jgi:hypothetical protein